MQNELGMTLGGAPDLNLDVLQVLTADLETDLLVPLFEVSRPVSSAKTREPRSPNRCLHCATTALRCDAANAVQRGAHL